MAYPTEVEIQAVMDARKINRMSAVQYLRRQGKKAAPVVAAEPTAKPATVKAAAPAKPKAARPAKKTHKPVADLPKKSSEQVKVDREVLYDIIRKSLRSAYGKVCPILGVLGQRFTVPSQKSGYPYLRVLCDTPDGLKTMFISGFYDGQEAKHTMSDADPKSYTVKALLKRIEARTKRAAAKLAGKD